MCSRFLSAAVLIVASLTVAAAAQERDLRVCADPDNLPFSNRQMEGFENRIADVLARELNATLRYTWQRTGRGFLRTFLNGGECDVLIGAPAGWTQALTTTAYYRGTFVFVSHRARQLTVRSLDDPVLRTLRVGVQFGDEGYTAPGVALGRRGFINNLVPFRGIGGEAGAVIDAVVRGDVDVAVVWAPLAGYMALQHRDLLHIQPMDANSDDAGFQMSLDVALAVRKDNSRLRADLQRALDARRADVTRILATYGVVPVVQPRRAGGAK